MHQEHPVVTHSTGDTAKLQHTEIKQQQITMLASHLLPVLIINALVAAVMLFGLWGLFPAQSLIIWIVLLYLVLFARGFALHQYQKSASATCFPHWGLVFALGSGLSGLLWGMVGVVFYPLNALEYQLFILVVLTGMSAGAISTLTAYLPAFYAFVIPAMLPIGIMFLLEDDRMHTTLGLMTFIYAFGMPFFARNINRSLVETLKLRFENLQLVHELSFQKEEAEQANIAKSKFLAAASHDLRQPLHALLLFTSVLDESIKYPRVRKVVDQIRASVDALQSLFNALLDISRLEAGVLVAETSHFNLQPMFEKLANDYSLAAGEKGLALEFKACKHAVYSDPALLEQIMRNFVANAIRYTNKGMITISCADLCEFVRIDVMDTGVGIPEDKQQAIFTEFYQLGNPQRDRSKGLGLGLAIVERIARLLKHSVTVHSRPGEGSTFSIIVDKGDVAVIHDRTIQAVATQHAAIEHLTIVVVDDELSIREGMQSLLETWGCQIIATVTLNEAIDDLAKHHLTPDGIIADYRLGGEQTGIHVIQQLHAEYGEHLPALIVTGDIEADRLREVSESGFQLLHKPVAPSRLRAFVNNVMKNKQRQGAGGFPN
ncbi:MAG: hybrid sensor histidine kinase/response regulator [Gammaproteobacteria bacterium]|nr:hybrid sensor histidine kinase/response regulator [Gammaproteobacteria bacterium]